MHRQNNIGMCHRNTLGIIVLLYPHNFDSSLTPDAASNLLVSFVDITRVADSGSLECALNLDFAKAFNSV